MDEADAETKGLLAGDLLVSLGSATRMSELPALVAANEDSDVPVSVLRGESRLELQLHPKKWAGESLSKAVLFTEDADVCHDGDRTRAFGMPLVACVGATLIPSSVRCEMAGSCLLN